MNEAGIGEKERHLARTEVSQGGKRMAGEIDDGDNLEGVELSEWLMVGRLVWR